MSLILVIDDSRTQRVAAAIALKREGHAVLEASGGEDGLTIARNDHPNLILCDLQMPGMDGHEFLDHLRHDHSIPYIPVIMLTSETSRAHMRRAMTSGADDYLGKPFSFQELNEAVTAVLTKRDSQRNEFVNSAMDEFESAVQGLKDTIGGDYERRLVEAVANRWDEAGESNVDERFDDAVVLLLDSGAQSLVAQRVTINLARTARLIHQAAREGLLSFGADRVVAFGNQLLAVFATATEGGPSPGTRALDAAFLLASELDSMLRIGSASTGADIGLTLDLFIAITTGEVSLLHMNDPLHGDAPSTLATGAAVFDAAELLALARRQHWPIACSERFLGTAGHRLKLGDAVPYPGADAGQAARALQVLAWDKAPV